MRSLALLVGAIALFVSCGSTPPTPISGAVDGAWSNPVTWGGKTPDANTAVTIPAGKTITLDSSVNVRSITVNGALQWADADNLELKANWIMVESGGAFRLGSAEQPFTKRATITLTGSDTSENVMTMGTKFLGAMGGGRIEIFGEDRVSWTKLNASVAAGGSSLLLKDSVPWRVGERVVIASSSMNPDEAEERGINGVSSDGRTITLDVPLRYAHFGQLQNFEGRVLDERAEVGLLSRNIVIQGDDASTALKFGGHVMVMTNGSSAKIQGVEFRRMGQFNRLGRYPVHFHLLRDATGSFVRASSVNRSIQRGIVVHGSDNVRVEKNVVFDTVGHGYALEDGSERGAVFEGNLGLLSREAKFTADGLKDQNDQLAATYWLRTAAGTLTNNVSAGGDFAGFWFDMGFVEGNNATKSMLNFRDNVAHSHRSGKQGDANTWAFWHTDGYVPSEEGILTLENITAYKNARAIETSGRGVAVNAMLADNGKAITGILLRDSVVVSRSANTDTDEDWGRTGMFAYGGHANAENVSFVGFKDGRRVSSTLACGIEYPRFNARNVKLVDSDLAAGCGDVIQHDLDGSLSGTGQPRKLVNLDNSFGLVTPQCQRLETLGVAVCPDVDYRTLGVTYPMGPSARFSNDDWFVDVVRDEDGNRVTPNHFRWISYVVPGKTYRLEVRNAKNSSDATAYGLSKLSHVDLGFSAGDLSDPDPLLGTRNVVYDPQWVTRSLVVSTSLPTGAFRIRFCKHGATCDDDPAKWTQITATSSLNTLQTQSSSGFFADGNTLYFKFFGGDRMRYERL